MFFKSKAAAKRQSFVSNSKEVAEVGARRSTEEDDQQYVKKEEAVSVTRQLCIKSPENSRNLDKQVVLRRIRHRKRMNKVRAAVGAILGTTTTGGGGDSSVQQKKWVDDAFAAL